MNNRPYFDEVAQDWDRMRASFFSEAIRDQALALADLRPGRKAVDVGAGTGFMTEGLLASGLEVVAVDASKAMLDTLELSGNDDSYRNKAIKQLNRVKNRVVVSKHDVTKNILNTILALSFLHKISINTDDIRQVINITLRVWQVRWAYWDYKRGKLKSK